MPEIAFKEGGKLKDTAKRYVFFVSGRAGMKLISFMHISYEPFPTIRSVIINSGEEGFIPTTIQPLNKEQADYVISREH